MTIRWSAEYNLNRLNKVFRGTIQEAKRTVNIINDPGTNYLLQKTLIELHDTFESLDVAKASKWLPAMINALRRVMIAQFDNLQGEETRLSREFLQGQLKEYSGLAFDAFVRTITGWDIRNEVVTLEDLELLNVFKTKFIGDNDGDYIGIYVLNSTSVVSRSKENPRYCHKPRQILDEFMTKVEKMYRLQKDRKRSHSQSPKQKISEEPQENPKPSSSGLSMGSTENSKRQKTPVGYNALTKSS